MSVTVLILITVQSGIDIVLATAICLSDVSIMQLRVAGQSRHCCSLGSFCQQLCYDEESGCSVSRRVDDGRAVWRATHLQLQRGDDT